MGLEEAKKKVKEIVSFDLIDITDEINSKGNYIYLSGFKKKTLVEGYFTFTITIAGTSFTGDDDSIEKTLSELIDDVAIYERTIDSEIDLKADVKRSKELLLYSVELTIVSELG